MVSATHASPLSTTTSLPTTCTHTDQAHSGLVLASAYLTTPAPVDYSFALDKPLHTTALVLLLTGLVLVAVEAWSSRRRPHHHHHHHHPHQHQPLSTTTYVAFALNNVQARHPGEEIWTEAGLHVPRRPWGLRAVGALLAVLLFAICGRIAIFYRVTTNVECTGPSPLVRTSSRLISTPHTKPAQAFLPLVVALYHSLRHPSQRQYPAWSADTRMRSPLDRVFGFVFNGSTRYIIPSLLLAISTFLVSIKSTTLRSSYICPIANSDATAVPSLQFVGFLLDCLILQVLYRLVDDGVSEPDDWSILLQDGTSNHVLVGMTFIVGRVAQLSAHPIC